MHGEVRQALGRLTRQRCARTGVDRRRPRFLRGTGPRRSRGGPRLARASILASRSTNTTTRWCWRCTHLPMPVIAAVNGVAAGAGANIALACDIVIAARSSASFVQAFSKLGLMPDSGGTWVLPRLVGDARALGLTLLGNKLPAEQAAAWGMIWQCVEDAELGERRSMRSRSNWPWRRPADSPATKAAIRGSWQHSLAEQLDIERDVQRELGRSGDYAEGVAAFTEKRIAALYGPMSMAQECSRNAEGRRAPRANRGSSAVRGRPGIAISRHRNRGRRSGASSNRHDRAARHGQRFWHVPRRHRFCVRRQRLSPLRAIPTARPWWRRAPASNFSRRRRAASA